jgi:YesN/AraC family two-component response regulator
MSYQEFTPHPLLQPYIVCYWSSKTGRSAVASNIFSDGCSDIIFSLGADVAVTGGTLKHGHQYLVGIMTHFHQVQTPAETHLLGIRFKPFGIYALLGIPLEGMADQTEPLTSSDFSISGINPSATGVIQKLETYFLQRLNDKHRLVVSLSETILAVNGNITVQQLASRHHITERKIERLFQSRAGATVKEICKQVRFQSTLKKIQANPAVSFAQIAFEMGYYDHAHMLKDVKRYSGLTLSRIAS